MTRAALVGLCLLAGLGPVWAADRATLSVIGYASEGGLFAYEQFSIGDEGTPPHSAINIIDLTTGQSLAGAPFSAMVETEEETLNAVRDSVWGMAGEVLAEHNITEPANPLVLLGDGDRSEDTTLRFGMAGSGEPGSVTGTYAVSLRLIDMPKGAACDPEMGAQKGFVLTLSAEGVERPVYADTTLPADRACAIGYRLYGIYSPHNGGGPESWVAMVSVFSRGFEGSDRRFVAVPLGMRAP